MVQGTRCANCEGEIVGDAVVFDGGTYCCHGCVAGGPCVCALQQRTPSTSGASSAVTAPDPDQPAKHVRRFEDLVMSLSGRATDVAVPPGDTDAPPLTPDRRGHLGGASRPVVLRVGQFADQQDLLHFAHLLENCPGLTEVSLTRADVHDAWFAVRVYTMRDVIAALEQLEGYEFETDVHDASVEASIVYRAGRASGAVAGWPDAGTAPAADTSGQAAVLPRRQRFRVFRSEPHQGNSSDKPSSPDAPAHRPGRPSDVRRFWDVFGVPAAPTGHTADMERRRPSIPEVNPRAPVVVSPLPPVRPGAAPPATAPVAPPHSLIGIDERPGSAGPPVEHLTVVAFPFHSFEMLNEFHDALRALPDVTATRVLRFYRGTLHLAVEHEDRGSPTELLEQLDGFELRVALASARHVEVELLAPSNGPSGPVQPE